MNSKICSDIYKNKNKDKDKVYTPEEVAVDCMNKIRYKIPCFLQNFLLIVKISSLTLLRLKLCKK